MRCPGNNVWRVGAMMFLALMGGAEYLSAQLLPPQFVVGGGPVPAGFAFSLTNLNSSGAILFTTDGSDPRTPVGSVCTNARTFRWPVTVNRTVTVQARVRHGTNWSAITNATFSTSNDYTRLVISEIAYQPPGTNSAQERSREFAEIKNIGTETLDISGVWFRGYAFPGGTTIAPGEFKVLIRDTNAYLADHPGGLISGGPFQALSNSDSDVGLFYPAGTEMFWMRYETYPPWPTLPDDHNFSEKGFSLVMANPNGHSDPRHYHSWRTSVYQGGSPGADDPPDTRPRILVTEVLARPGDTGYPLEAVEIFNPQHTNVNIGGWYLTDRRELPQGFRLPTNIVVPARGHLVLSETLFRTGTTNDIGFSSFGNDVFLFSASSNGTLTGWGHGFWFLGSERGVSYGLHINSLGEEFFVPQSQQSLGMSNAGPLIGPAVITELMLHPPDGELRFVELVNTTDAALPLFDPQFPEFSWTLSFVGSAFTFPSNTVIPPRSMFLVVEGSVEVFRTRYSVPANVPIFSGLSSTFMSTEETVYLRRVSGRSGIITRIIPVETLHAKFEHPWPAGARGTGASLERLVVNEFGDDPRNWRLSPTGSSPGRTNSSNRPPLVSVASPQFASTGQSIAMSAYAEDDGLPRVPGVVTQLWKRVSGAGAVVISNATQRSTRVWFESPGTNVLQFMAGDGSTVSITEVEVIALASAIEAWRLRNFTTGELASASISGDAADPDGDGRANIVEYALGLNPRQPDNARSVRVEMIDGRLTIHLRKATEADDIVLHAEAASFVNGPWISNGSSPEIEVLPSDEEGMGTWRIRDQSTNAPHRFIRLSVGRVD